jgi:para-nitrobenzyl esterase
MKNTIDHPTDYLTHKALFRRAFLVLTVVFGLAGCSESDTQRAVESAAEASPASGQADALIATTQAGKVRGFMEDGVLVFKGIRYGADTATTRFMAPKPPAPWSDVKDVVAYGNSTRQASPSGRVSLFASWATDPTPELSEDCLFLNVWTPALRDGKKRPVMVWFHGGGFTSGSGSSNAYDGVRLVNRGDVVVVSVNHRLNIFAHLYLGEYGEQYADSGTSGILDLVHSLKWVRDNIAEFGGDPGNVLIFGESGGGMKVTTLMAMDDAKGLFHRAVVQSGPYLTLTKAEAAAAGAEKIVAELGLSAESIDQIRSLPAEQIEKAAQAVAQAGQRPTWNGPILDGKNLKRDPFTPDAPPQSETVPMLIGTTRTENSLFIGLGRPETFDLTWEQLPAAVTQLADGRDVDKIIAEYRRLRPEYGPAELLYTASTDAGFLNRSIEQADKKTAQGGAPVYFYQLYWDTPVDGGKWLSPHASEIGMVFDNVAKSESMSGIGEEQQKIADMMSEAWLAFARSGNPNHAGLPAWPEYGEERAVMLFDLTPQVVNDPHGPQRKIFLDQ